MDLADHDGVDSCVSASAMGKPVYEALGYTPVAVFPCEGYPEHPDPITDYFLIRPKPTEELA